MDSSSIAAPASWLEGRLEAMEAELAPLVDCNSFTGNPEGVNATGERLREHTFAIDGLDLTVIPSQRFGDHLVFRTHGRGGPPVALVGHHDTVFPPGTFEGYRRDGELARGPGVLDMKGGLVTVAFALRALAETVGLDNVVPLVLVIVGDEEVGSPEGAGVIREHAKGAQAALVFEAGRAKDAIITRRKGSGGLTVRVRGLAAHAGNHHADGISAIRALAHFVLLAEALTDYAAGSTVNVGKVEGGVGKNTVPDSAMALVDIRYTSKSAGESLVEGLHAAARRAESEVPGAKIELEGGIVRMPLERSPRSAELAARYKAAALPFGIGGDEASLIGGGSDASTTSQLGIPSIDGLGPRGKGFHTHDEQIEASSLVLRAQALAQLLATWSPLLAAAG